jgi:hypothetical protein
VDKGTKHYYLYNNDGNRIELEQYDGEKDIGVLVDENLSFNKHIQNQVNKANSIMGLIRRTYTYLDEQSFKYLFQGGILIAMYLTNFVNYLNLLEAFSHHFPLVFL